MALNHLPDKQNTTITSTLWFTWTSDTAENQRQWFADNC